MSTKMRELLTSAVASREGTLDEDDSFAARHAVPVRRAIQRRRVATYAGTGTVATVATLGAIYGFQAWSGGASNPAVGPPATTVETPAPSEVSKITTSLVEVPIDESIYEPGETSRVFVYYATMGDAEMGPFPPIGLYYPGIADVPTDAFIVTVSGDIDGYDLDGPDADHGNIGAVSLAWDQGDLVGDRTPATLPITWEALGHVSSTTEWGVRYFMADGRLVTVAEGESNPDAIEVVAMFVPPAGS